MSSDSDTFSGWAILELMGHRRLAGYVTETELAGQGVLRLDVPAHPWVDGCTCGSGTPASLDPQDHRHVCQMFRAPDDEQPGDVHATQFYAPTALYCLTPTTEQVARGLAARSRPAPVARWELPAPAPSPGAFVAPWEEDGEPEDEGPDEHTEDEWQQLQERDA